MSLSLQEYQNGIHLTSIKDSNGGEVEVGVGGRMEERGDGWKEGLWLSVECSTWNKGTALRLHIMNSFQSMSKWTRLPCIHSGLNHMSRWYIHRRTQSYRYHWAPNSHLIKWCKMLMGRGWVDGRGGREWVEERDVVSDEVSHDTDKRNCCKLLWIILQHFLKFVINHRHW